MTWLVINPNTSVDVTDRLVARIRRVAHGNIELRAETARFGAPYIASESSYAVAGHAVLDAWQNQGRIHESLAVDPYEDGLVPAGTPLKGILVGCFGDPGCAALQEISGIPVAGLAEASFEESCVFGHFVVVTGGVLWKPMLKKLAASLGYGKRLLDVHVLDQTGDELAAHPLQASDRLRQACVEAIAATGADAVILGGAGLTGLADAWSSSLRVPVIDSVDAGVRMLAQRIVRFEAEGGVPSPLAPHPKLLAWPEGRSHA